MDTLRLVLELSQEAMVLAYEDGTILEVSKRACEVFGYSVEELRALNRRDLIDLAEPRYQVALSERLRTGAFFGEVTLVRKGGARFPAEVSTLVVPATDGTKIVWTTLRDVTERNALREAEERYRALADATMEAVVLHNHGVILDTNATADKLFGLSAGMMIGRSVGEFIAPGSIDVALEKVEANESGMYESSGMRSDGSQFPCEARARVVTYRGESVRMVAIRDLTERKQLEARLALADRLASMGTLAAGVAHEINNPLSYILLNLEIAQSELANASPERPATHALSSVRDALEGTERVKRIVSDLRSFSRGSGDETASVDLERTVSFARAISANEVRHRATLDVRLAGLPPVRGNETRLGQVFLNLIMNAAQSIPDGSAGSQRISIVGRREGDAWVVVDVSDTGAGIPREILPRIFEPFVTSKSRAEGTGLGLSIAQSILTAMGGSISVTSTVGRGTTFTLRLPVADEVKAERVSPAPRASAQRHARVLVVDDEARIRIVIAQALRPQHEVVTASSGFEALTILERGEEFDAMLCDLMMPQMGGIDLHEQVATRWPELARHTGLLTGGAFSERAQRFVETSGLRCLEKPCTVAELQALVDDLTA